MNFSGRNPNDDQFQIAPMIDIVFILLIWFVVSYAAAQDEKMLDINLPEASAAKEVSRSLREIVVNLDADGGIFVNRRALSPEDLERRLRRLMDFSRSMREEGVESAEPGVIIRAHAECAHKHVIEVMDICARAEIRRVFFSTERRGSDFDDA